MSNTRQPVVAISLKMYFDPAKTLQFVSALAGIEQPDAELEKHGITGPVQDSSSTVATAALNHVELVVMPDFLSIRECTRLKNRLDEPLFNVGAQDCWQADEGAFTGEVSPKHLAQLGVRYVEIGHAERRKQFGETNEWVINKSAACSRNSIIPWICIGEINKGDIEACGDEVWEQIKPVLDNCTGQLVFAYEPVWAIGAPKPAESDHIIGVVSYLRKKIDAEKETNNNDVRIVYGGSAGPGLVESLNGVVDGLFLGRFGHNPDNVKKVVEEVGAVASKR
ncbi:YALI0F01584p [Yarrowia lipolytica CLIB122]|uniref:Triosephosphate isomerase n=2 Tax=Yarrowia lipolytica TaxID=4952 RepID=Q6C395_YARLI|nr:YALI0F01584p [Yarrowia lipolytica CLIB122]AOW06495.1 hypothetical protein YALI1_F02481g [Yarrowia lipolytica]KAB8282185.1 Triosephosphate isomerase [Yarrowia lipolytica]KAE8171956.1 Triosephosphate isomerase [Yarrowia lipolytica]KAJ8056251.1 Triosephosphate isomerase [Yarrowia lipolytica]RMI94864.1 Triosephosphate isomerase [Yarrowia lipolytica]|eukprot:XP_504867.1 YALI0F01584p [Yarrowia lipolytica CLIB122]